MLALKRVNDSLGGLYPIFPPVKSETKTAIVAKPRQVWPYKTSLNLLLTQGALARLSCVHCLWKQQITV